MYLCSVYSCEQSFTVQSRWATCSRNGVDIIDNTYVFKTVKVHLNMNLTKPFRSCFHRTFHSAFTSHICAHVCMYNSSTVCTAHTLYNVQKFTKMYARISTNCNNSAIHGSKSFYDWIPISPLRCSMLKASVFRKTW